MHARGITYCHQLLRMLHGNRPQHHCIDHGENRGVRPDAQGQCHQSNRREPGVLPQHSQPETQVLTEAFDQIDAAGISALLLFLLDSTKFQPGLPHCFHARHPAANEVFRIGFDVKPHLSVHFALHARALEKSAAPPDDARPERHTSSGFVFKIPAMTSAMRFHFSASASSLRLPAAVRR